MSVFFNFSTIRYLAKVNFRLSDASGLVLTFKYYDRHPFLLLGRFSFMGKLLLGFKVVNVVKHITYNCLLFPCEALLFEAFKKIGYLTLFYRRNASTHQ